MTVAAAPTSWGPPPIATHRQGHSQQSVYRVNAYNAYADTQTESVDSTALECFMSIAPPASSCSLSSRKNSTSLAVHRVPSLAGFSGCEAVIRCRFADNLCLTLLSISSST